MTTKSWTVEIRITEEERETTAEARLSIDEVQGLLGHGSARRNPTDSNVPAIGDELAAARALSDLSHRLLETAVETLEGVTGERVTNVRA
ncbi:MAG: dsRBD fold-containing protein [Nocardioidaceae bacterium]